MRIQRKCMRAQRVKPDPQNIVKLNICVTSMRLHFDQMVAGGTQITNHRRLAAASQMRFQMKCMCASSKAWFDPQNIVKLMICVTSMFHSLFSTCIHLHIKEIDSNIYSSWGRTVKIGGWNFNNSTKKGVCAQPSAVNNCCFAFSPWQFLLNL